MMWLCDKCGAALVVSGEHKPLSEIYPGSMEIPWKHGECDKCGSQENLMPYSGFTAEQYSKALNDAGFK